MTIVRRQQRVDFEELGYQTMLQCRHDEERARHICGLEIQAFDDELQPEITDLRSAIEQNKIHGAALHAHLYDRPEPVNDAAMLTHSKKARLLAILAALASIGCFAGNATTFFFFGFGPILTFFMALGITALPLVIGHLAYERIVHHHKKLQAAIIALAVILCFAGLYELAEARRTMVDKAAAETPTTASYVDGAQTPDESDQDQDAGKGTENQVRQTLGGAMLLIMIAADLIVGYLVGLLSKIHTDEDYAAWRTLREITKRIASLEKTIATLVASIEIAKKECTAGILKAQVTLSKRRIPYYKSLTGIVLLVVLGTTAARAQRVERYEGILIDTSGSISKGGATDELFKQYLIATKRLLGTETPNTRVWVSSIAIDSFGSDGTVIKGWTPEARGIFTDDLNRARHQLASAFEQKSSKLSPVASGTDIFGALWRYKTLFESDGVSGRSGSAEKSIWIFSDMVNETQGFQMPTLLPTGPGNMLERAKVNGLIVPLNGYKIYIFGATPSGLSPQAWLTIRSFWALYFKAAGAELVSYSPECEVQR